MSPRRHSCLLMLNEWRNEWDHPTWPRSENMLCIFPAAWEPIWQPSGLKHIRVSKMPIPHGQPSIWTCCRDGTGKVSKEVEATDWQCHFFFLNNSWTPAEMAGALGLCIPEANALGSGKGEIHLSSLVVQIRGLISGSWVRRTSEVRNQCLMKETSLQKSPNSP
jgi:hypothetical protein